MTNEKVGKLSPSKEIAYIAVMCALLIGGQYIFSFVAGVEIVTVLLVCFCAVFGVRAGVFCAVGFSLLRCLVFGFHPNVLMLYLVCYPALAALFGGLGHIRTQKRFPLWLAAAVNVVLVGISCACVLLYALDLIQVSRFYKVTLSVLVWIIFALCTALCVAFDILLVMSRRGRGSTEWLKVIAFTAAAAVCTVCFTLLDDMITPLFFGYTRLSTLAYFYTSFTAMLPQTVCTVVTVGLLFLPLTKVFETVKQKGG